MPKSLVIDPNQVRRASTLGRLEHAFGRVSKGDSLDDSRRGRTAERVELEGEACVTSPGGSLVLYVRHRGLWLGAHRYDRLAMRRADDVEAEARRLRPVENRKPVAMI